MQGGILYTHILGERFTPSFDILGRYAYKDASGTVLPDELFKQVLGQTILVEQRGDRQYASRDIVDLHWEWRTPRRASVLLDLFNVLGSDALTLINTNIGDQERQLSRAGDLAPRSPQSPCRCVSCSRREQLPT